MRRIPVFVSAPSKLSLEQVASRDVVFTLMDELQLEPRTLGASDYPEVFPLREVAVIAKHCSGGVILGFEQFVATAGVRKAGTDVEESLKTGELAAFPTPWNHLEAGILFGLGLPLMIFREASITGGVFDPGVTDVFVHKMPLKTIDAANRLALKQVFLRWYAKVSEHYYR